MDTISVFSTSDEKAWKTYLPASRNIFGSYEYCSLHEQLSGEQAKLLVYKNGRSVVVYPFFFRSINQLEFAKNIDAELWDINTPEYTGPLSNLILSGEEAATFIEAFSSYCRENRIVSGFAHLHPWDSSISIGLSSHRILNRPLVYIDLEKTISQLWESSFNYSCQKNIRRSNSSNVKVYPAASVDDVIDFYKIYTQTMDRVNADQKYYFPLSYFCAFFKRMPDNSRIMLANYEGRVVAATLYLFDDKTVYSYLGGSDHTFQTVRPANAVVYETIKWAKDAGKEKLLLGGGYRPNDGIFNFKASFSPLQVNFYVNKQIFLQEEYMNLIHSWQDFYQEELLANGYFPGYRSAPGL